MLLTFSQNKKLQFKPVFVLLSLVLSACSDPNLSTANSINVDSKSNPIKPINTATINSEYGRDAEFEYPQFSGKFPVATRVITLVDSTRLASFYGDTPPSNQLENRKIQVRFYYPSIRTTNSAESPDYLPVISSNAWDYLVGHFEIKGKQLRFDNYKNATWDIALDSDVAQSQPNFPVLIFSHGYGYNAESYSALSGELASLGFIVASINHTFGANPVEFEQNDIVWAKALKKNAIGSYLPTWSDDQILVIDRLSQINSNPTDPFYQKLDLINLGIFGHSYGGAASFHTASRDPRIKAIMDIDGTVFDFENRFVSQPFAFVLSQDHNAELDFDYTGDFSYQIKLKQFQHGSFTDHILWWQWDHDDLQLGFGSVDSFRATEITASLVNSFFSTHLSIETSDFKKLEELRSDELEVIYQ